LIIVKFIDNSLTQIKETEIWCRDDCPLDEVTKDVEEFANHIQKTRNYLINNVYLKARFPIVNILSNSISNLSQFLIECLKSNLKTFEEDTVYAQRKANGIYMIILDFKYLHAKDKFSALIKESDKKEFMKYIKEIESRFCISLSVQFH
jgi:hypothetical protein